MKALYAAGIVGLLAIAVIAVVGFQAMQSGSTSTSSGIGTTTGSHTGSNSATTSQGSTTQGSTSQGGSTGDFAMMATDPPVTAAGVTAATASYNSLAVHSAGSAQASGWTQLQGSGTINLMSRANVSQTVAAEQIATGTYDQVRMDIQSAQVTYNNKVYAATVASSQITSQLQSDAQVGASQSTAAVVDLRTFVINAANASQPQFVFSATAESTTVPPSATTQASFQVNATTNLQGSWWVGFNDQTSTVINISSVTLSNGSFSAQLNNSGNSSADIQTVVITPVSASGTLTAMTMPGSYSGSAMFTASGSGQLQASNSLQVAALLGGSGDQCNAGSSTSLSYSGTISLGFGVVGLQLNGIVSGQQYLITVMGANTYGTAVVTAH